VFRGQLSFPALKRKVIEQAEAYSPRVILIEDRGSGQSLIQVLQSETNLPIVAVKPGKRSKEVRAEPLAAWYEAGKILHPKDSKEAPWLEDFEDELLAFPYGRYDDQVDAMSQGVEWIMEKTRKRAWSRVF
ncbi:MAG: phage terminase large subunit, partial [Candidatus Bathyarchaeota archaeon]|nr:phage terminase large subunit [Candidatus Bathyarchaeota archaeon]